MRIICFFHSKGGAGTTSLVYHLSWKLADLGYRVVAADLDPQAGLSEMFLSEDASIELLESSAGARTVYQAMLPLMSAGDIARVTLETSGKLALLPGDIRLSAFEDALSKSWMECLGEEPHPFYVLTAFHRLLRQCTTDWRADVALVDLGAGLGAITRAALLCADHLVIPVSADSSSVYGLRILGLGLEAWRQGWAVRRAHLQSNHGGIALDLPEGAMKPAGYAVTQPAPHAGGAGRAYRKWLSRIPEVYLRDVCLDHASPVPPIDSDPSCLAQLKHYRSLMAMAQEARKPIFHLTPADGAIGAHSYAARDCSEDFRKLAEAIVQRCGIHQSDPA